MTDVLIVSHDIVADRMAGVGIRYYEVARALSHAHRVTLAAPTGSALPASARETPQRAFVTYEPADWSTLRGHLAHCDVLFAYPDTLWLCKELIPVTTAVVVDGYDLALLEHLELDAGRLTPEEQAAWQHQQRLISQFALERGDFFVCATARQRDWWLGALASAGRINSLTRRQDPSFRGLVGLLPYGISNRPPVHTRPVMRGVMPGITQADKIVLWGGGIWQWLDPLTLIRAAALLASARPDIKFVFPGIHHPASDLVPRMAVQAQAVDLAGSLGLLNRNVFMGQWVPYDDWQSYLLESDVGVSLHWDHLEAHMSARTRVLSYVWALLPMVLTRGDELAERMAQAGVATLVAEGDVEAVAAAIEKSLNIPATHTRAAFDSLRPTLYWSTSVASLKQFCDHPRCAADKEMHMRIPTPSEPRQEPARALPEASDSQTAAQPQLTMTQPVPQTDVPELTIPMPMTPLNRLLWPAIRSLFVWYLAEVVKQQKHVNASVLGQLAQIQMQLAGLENDLATFAGNVTNDKQATQTQVGALRAGVATLAGDRDVLFARVSELLVGHTTLAEDRDVIQARVGDLLIGQTTLAEARDNLQAQAASLVAGYENLSGDRTAMMEYLVALQKGFDQLDRILNGEAIPRLENVQERLSDVESLQTEIAAALAKMQIESGFA